MARHKIDIEKIEAQAALEDQRAERLQFKRGQWLAFALSMALILCGTGSILKGHDWAGAAIITGTLASLVFAFLWGKRAGEEETRRGEEENPEEQANDLKK